MREWEIAAVENIHGALPYIRFAPILALVGVGVNRIGKEASSTIQAIVALIASALYLATYLSFVHLLGYPRNWHPFSLPESLATAVMAALTVTLVSLSPDGIDRPALAIMVGFFIVVFYVIAAPAIAFRPASRPVEFLALTVLP